MKNMLIPAALIAVMGFGGVAFAASTAPVSDDVGEILLLEPDTGSVTLVSGEHYVVPGNIVLNRFHETQTVRIDYQQSGRTRVVKSITLAN